MENTNFIDVRDNQIVNMPDYLIVLPYLKERNQVLMKYVQMPAFSHSMPHIEKWLTGAVHKLNGECTKEDVENAVKDHFNMTIKIEPEIIGPMFIDSSCTTKCYICVLPLLEHEYSLEPAQEKSPIALNCSELSNYIIYDLPSKFCLDVFKKDYSLY